MNTPGERLKSARIAAGFDSARSAAEAHGWNVSTYSGHENGSRQFTIDTAKQYASVFRTSWLWLKEGVGAAQPEREAEVRSSGAILTRGEVAAGRWLDLGVDLDPSDFEQYPIAPHPDYPFRAQYGLIVRGTSINRVAAPGEVLHCVDTREAGIHPQEGELVIVERRQQQEGRREVTAKRIRVRGTTAILEPDTTDPRWQPIEFDSTNVDDGHAVEIVALVIGKYTPIRKRK